MWRFVARCVSERGAYAGVARALRRSLPAAAVHPLVCPADFMVTNQASVHMRNTRLKHFARPRATRQPGGFPIVRPPPH